MTLADYLSETFVRNALIAATLVAITAGLIGPVVIMRDLAFAVHGTAELAFTGAAAGLVAADDPLLGALLGSIVVATAVGFLGNRVRERNSAIGVILGFGLGVGVYLLSLYKGFATAATNILFGQIFGVSPGQITLLTAIAVGVLIAMVVLYRPLLFASVDPDLAEARGVRTRLVGLLFVYVLALTVTEAAQVVGTLLVLSLAITPAAAATRLSARIPVVIAHLDRTCSARRRRRIGLESDPPGCQSQRLHLDDQLRLLRSCASDCPLCSARRHQSSTGIEIAWDPR